MYNNQTDLRTMAHDQDINICFASIDNQNFYAVNEIAYVCAHEDRALIVLNNGRIEEVDRTLEQLGGRLMRFGFLKVFNMYLVNQRFIKSSIHILNGQLIMPDGNALRSDFNYRHKYRLKDILNLD
jgi:DNA-binding LytR/AlgR family response regulator